MWNLNFADSNDDDIYDQSDMKWNFVGWYDDIKY